MGFWIVKNTLYAIHSLEYKFMGWGGEEYKEKELLLRVVLCEFGGPIPPITSQLPLDFSGTKAVFNALLKILSSLQNLVLKLHN